MSEPDLGIRRRVGCLLLPLLFPVVIGDASVPVQPLDGPTSGRANDPFPILLGHTRSGTTMLRAMVDSHPEVAVPPESYFVVPLLSRIRMGSLDFDAMATFLAQDRYFPDWQLSVDAVDALRSDPRVRTGADAIAGLYAAYARARGKPRYADKTPSHLHAVDLLAEQFPNARFLHIVRDGRDVAASVITMDFGADQFAEAASGWGQKILVAHDAGVRLGPGRYHEVQYEQLVARPEEVLRQVCAFFDFEYSATMLQYHERAEELLDGLRHAGHIQGIRRPPTVGVRNWRLDLTPHQIAVFDEVAGDALEAVGYARSGLRRSSRARVEAIATEAKLTARRTRRVYLPRVVRKLKASYRRVRP